MRGAVDSIGYMLVQVAGPLLLIGLHITAFGVLAFVLFSGISETNCTTWAPGEVEYCSTFSLHGCTNYWSNFGDAAMHMFTVLTTSNFPNIMTPVYTCNPANALLFVAFVVVGNFLLVNLLIATAFSAFNAAAAANARSRIAGVIAAIEFAFTVLSSGTTSRAELPARAGVNVLESVGPATDAASAATYIAAQKGFSARGAVPRDAWVGFMVSLAGDHGVDARLAERYFDAAVRCREAAAAVDVHSAAAMALSGPEFQRLVLRLQGVHAKPMSSRSVLLIAHGSHDDSASAAMRSPLMGANDAPRLVLAGSVN